VSAPLGLTRAELAKEDVRPSKATPIPAGYWHGSGAHRVPPSLASELAALRAKLAEWRPGT
jgi:hypothetical protein